MRMTNDTRRTRPIGAGLTIGHDNARDVSLDSCYNTYMNDALQTSNLPDRASTSARVSVASIVSKGQTTMTMIFLASDSSDTLAFSNIGTALDYVRDSHADLNPEGSALMLETRAGLVPATNKAVKASRDRVMRFSAAGADAASVVAGIQSKLDGALSACALVGIDPANVATVGNLRAALLDAQASIGAESASVTLTIETLYLHKRGYKN
mgnify:FL=1